jgi:L-aspartate oxidase
LTESVVAGTRLGRDLAWELPAEALDVGDDSAEAGLIDPAHKTAIRTTMSRHAGVLRDATGLAEAATTMASINAGPPSSVPPSQAAYEATNIATVATALLAAAAARSESRGCHRRSDHPEPRPEWVTHLRVGLTSSPDAGPVAVVGGPSPAVVAP